ncbi:nuclear transport factor 2 family protein [Acinetobacter baumannii]
MLHDVDMTKLLLHLEQLKAQQEIRNCINRYMEICDALDAHTDLNELMNLFDAECIWEGIGEKYAKTFGRYDSWQAIYNMFKSYTQQESHFVMNAHFLSSEQIYIEQDRAHASWLMLQTSTFRDERSHLNAAKLTVHFQQQVEGMWKIKHFQTENIFSRPVSHWNSSEELPVPNQN